MLLLALKIGVRVLLGMSFQVSAIRYQQSGISNQPSAMNYQLYKKI